MVQLDNHYSPNQGCNSIQFLAPRFKLREAMEGSGQGRRSARST